MPISYHLPAGLLLLLVGLVACFAGYRLLKFVLAAFGFLAGAWLAAVVFVPSDPTAKILAILLGGLVGALVFSLAYIVGVAAVGGWVGLVASHAAWMQATGHPPGMIVVALFVVAGAVVAAISQRFIVIAVTAFGGAQTAVAGALALASAPAARRVLGLGEAWFGQGGVPLLGRRWPLVAWILLGIVGGVVQLRGRSRRK